MLYILLHWSMHYTSSTDTAFNLATTYMQQWLVIVLTLVSECTTGLIALDEKPAVQLTTPNQLMELPHPQSHDDASTKKNCEC